ncbi:hypothetical protein ACFP3T_04885 [Lactiplantibacillus dongliensis]|uniref:Bacteriocin n=1 Tax=Lactiplantibacillus dongliensis TaxID=2559919 RepID=A0ABW1R2I2_9LACO|nr:hypothetical protein [Lactiplantibacillus dongliensis]
MKLNVIFKNYLNLTDADAEKVTGGSQYDYNFAYGVGRSIRKVVRAGLKFGRDAWI